MAIGLGCRLKSVEANQKDLKIFEDRSYSVVKKDIFATDSWGDKNKKKMTCSPLGEIEQNNFFGLRKIDFEDRTQAQAGSEFAK